MAEKISIMEFVGEVLPTKKVTLPKGHVIIKAVDAETILSTAPTIKELIDKLTAQNVTAENFQDPETLKKVIFTIIGNFLPLLSDATNIVEKDLRSLPPDILIAIIQATLEVNVKSKDTFIKNWNSLVATGKALGVVVPKEAPQKQTSAKSSKN